MELLKKIIKRMRWLVTIIGLLSYPAERTLPIFNFFLLDPVYHAISATTAQ